VGLFSIVVFLIVWLLRIWLRQNRASEERQDALSKQITEAHEEMESIRAIHRECERKLNLLYAEVNSAGIRIPPSVWEP
jgi:F0F1-type ATP synthase membrane subunit b/b'